MPTPDLTDYERSCLEEVRDCQKMSEEYLSTFRDLCDERFAHYQGFKGLSAALNTQAPRDRDVVLRDAQDEWGADLVIPFAFSTVETILSRAVSNRPKMLVLPKDEDAERNVENMRYLIDQQQQQIHYELKLEDTAKGGFIYGLGAQKLYWKTEKKQRRALQQQVLAQPDGTMAPAWIEGPPRMEVSFDDWTAEDIDLADLFWDPFGYDADSLRWIIHRTWRPTKYVVDMIRNGYWNTAAAKSLDPEDVDGMGGTVKWDEAFQTRMKAAGFETARNQRGKQLHEVWEFHDGERVITVLDREVPVQHGSNPNWHGQIPFQFFRPSTAGIKQLPGRGVIDPIAQLLREISTLRSQRRDNAALKLAQVFAANDGAMEASDMQFFPGAVWPVHGDPKEALYPINVGDIPNSSYNEEDRIVGDIERTTGISDSVTGAEASGGAQTATGVQLVQAAANVRIQKQTRRLEVELVMRAAGQAVALNQQRIVSERTIMVPAIQKPGEMGPVWSRIKLGPGELAGRFIIDVEGGSTAPKNVPQMRQDAQALDTFKGDPMYDQRAVARRKLELMGFSHPEAYLAPEAPPIPADVLKRLEQAGIDPELIQAVVAQAQREDPTNGQQSNEGQQQAAPGAPAPAEEMTA